MRYIPKNKAEYCDIFKNNAKYYEIFKNSNLTRVTKSFSRWGEGAGSIVVRISDCRANYLGSNPSGGH